MIRVYQPALTDAQIVAINSGNDVGHIYDRYLKATINVSWDRVCNAFEFYRHAFDVATDSPEVVFEQTNIGGDLVEWRADRPKSGSVGDVLIADGSNRGWICDSFGWIELSRDQVRYFETKVSTVMHLVS